MIYRNETFLNLFEQVIGPTGLLKNKTRILVTHAVKYLPMVDRIVVLKDGLISEMGNYKELLKDGKDFADFLIEYIQDEEGKTLNLAVRQLPEPLLLLFGQPEKLLRKQLASFPGPGWSLISEIAVN